MAEGQGAKYYRIVVRGIVQGVGFRPFVCREAAKYGIRGVVRNVAGEVEIMAAGSRAAEFAEGIRRDRPPNSVINSVEMTPAAPFAADGFSVAESGTGRAEPRFFPPDLALCGNCRAEIFDPENRRARHFFNSCTACGPRFSVLASFPYDRANTAMRDFPMCPDCLAEYGSPENPRFRDENACCPKCGPKLFYRRGDITYAGGEAFERALEDLPGGIAVKGVGGYHLACSPYDAEAVRRLRLLKAREKKPFALMFKDIQAVSEVCEVAPEEKKMLLSPARPIVLLKMRQDPFAREVLAGADGRCGCFLPYTALQELIMAGTPCLVMTSANLSSAPIISGEAEIFGLTGRVLYHDREIIRSVEDSVMQYAGGPRFIRRARGFAPLPISVDNPRGAELLAAGGDLKAAFGLLRGPAFILSQYIGDLEDARTFERYEQAAADFESLFAARPEAVVCDAHPRYFSSALAGRLAAARGLPLTAVFHHHAHVASVMAEHGLSRVLGAAFDGSGYGEDGSVWGGEFLLCEEERCRRVGHLACAEIQGADSAARDAAKTAACLLYANGLPYGGLPFAHERGVFTFPDKTAIEAALANHVNTFLTSSMGRLFDAVAALLGVCRENGYEGECAVRLQYAAEKEAKAGVKPAPMSFEPQAADGVCVFGCRDILSKCLEAKPGAALGFHAAVSEMVRRMCILARDKEHVRDVALSGGVFQNALLLEMTAERLKAAGFSVYANEAVPPNDGGLALGQAYIGARRIIRR